MNLKTRLGHYRHHHVVTKAHASLKALFTGQPLPAGKFVMLDAAEQADQKFLLKHSRKVGPVFKAVFDEKLCVCIIGLPLCRRFLQENWANLTPQTMDLSALFPEGFLRGMSGETHKKYRKATILAIDSELLSRDHSVIEEIVTDELAHYAENQQPGASPPEIYIQTLSTITSRVLLYIFFGACVGTERFAALMKMYNSLGPNGVVWSIGEPQKKAFYEIRDYLLEHLEQQGGAEDLWMQQSIMGRMHNNGALDETSLGNLIYMVEMGRYDMHHLFRWLSKYAGENPGQLERIRDSEPRVNDGNIAPSEAFVLETLRLNQSERLMRVVNRDIAFDGCHIPKNFMVRLCMWESHKLPGSFEDAFSFKPERFTAATPDKDQFSPFGMHQHSCPFADISTGLSAIFISILANNYTVEPIGNGPPARGEYHWQPANQFSVRLTQR